MIPPQLIIISGLSGSGKSVTLNTLEDAGFFCIDNFPSPLLSHLVDLIVSSNGFKKHQKLAISMDAREKDFLKNFNKYYTLLKKIIPSVKIIFLDANDKILIQRFSSTRRRHPLSKQGSIQRGITTERNLLVPVLDKANKIIDTSHLNVHQLKNQILKSIKALPHHKGLNITLLSFGYHFGVPHNADIVMDVRFVANPYFDPHLKALTGKHERIKRFVLDQKPALSFINRFEKMLNFLIGHYEKEGKAYLTVALGCTGGHHRSVAFTEILAKLLKNKGYSINVVHRDLTS
ncbi:MAG: RNase adaptor protein RapZ [Deltaproteobacteria bacterium RIFCSPLOWO2_02_FULL_50_16]|nr:MAG: RNase adaptor protein RapZ [Deltaproteobacteria bacterium GWA2_50_8]OGQ29419.1 MAG: RNase adaptor protein RapZ [Deltaproteobacteria bacterium RIFCSPHIGHO2_02_FULL_50_15]OGQ56056.1 MAG: RNase adaptor protein RapZ [Deltaproteobacteria bacterium RIFCSPLOWO2_02_FULL_50_16]OGQ68326.1 MAG: RNase adaptor protein RapZ [Deltaproteobacteria bacterium RIFCSPLOWO2_12_FULL_50_11]